MNFPDPVHISTVPIDGWGNSYGNGATYEPDGLCHCDPAPESSPIGECPDCHRLDPRKAYA